MDTILVNQLPVRTWNRLGVNATALPWDQAASRELEQTHIAAKAGGQETVRLSVQGEGEYSEKVLWWTRPRAAVSPSMKICAPGSTCWCAPR